MKIPANIWHKAIETVKNNPYEEDRWFGLSKYYDLNVWNDECNVTHGTIYPVVNGNTDTSIFVEIPHELFGSKK